MSSRTSVLLVLVALVATALPLATPDAAADVPPECLHHGGIDVFFLFDLTGSMGGVLSSAKSGATGIMADLNANFSDIRFGVGSHMDYPAYYSYPGYSTSYGSFGDYPWRFDRDLTTDTAAVDASIQALSLGSGDDWPEDYTRALYEAANDASWGADRLKLIVYFGDAQPHDADWDGQNTGGDPGRDAIAQTADDLDFQTVATGLAVDGIHVLGVDSGSALRTFGYLRDVTDGGYFRLASTATLRDDVVRLIQGAIRNDSTPPAVGFTFPSPTGPSRVFVDGADAGPSPVATHAVARGNLALSLDASDNCLLDHVDYFVDGAPIGSATTAPFGFTWASGTAAPGLHTVEARAVDWVGLTTPTIMPIEVLRLDQSGLGLSIYAATNIPEALEATVGGSSASGAAHADARTWGAGAVGTTTYEALRDESSTTGAPPVTAASSGVSQVTAVSIAGGLVTARAVRAEAHAAFDVTSFHGTHDAAGSLLTDVRVNGIPVPDVVPGQSVPLPGGGFVRFFEVVDGSSSASAIVQVNMIHVFLDSPSQKGEVIVASARAAAGFVGSSTGQQRAIDRADDAGTAGDAQPDLAHATPIAPGAYSGQFDANDRADAYSFTAGEGDRIVLVAHAAQRVAVSSTQQPTAPPPDPHVAESLGTTTLAIDLYDPTGAKRDTTDLGYADRIEFNADRNGTWTGVVRTLTAGRSNYTLLYEQPPVVFLDADGGAPGDAPAACASGRVLGNGATAGSMRIGDEADAYRFPVEIGDSLAVVLKPDELDDGANFDLVLLDPDCNVLMVSTLGGSGLLPKATPDVVFQLPAARTGMYGVIVVRVDGVGNYDLAVAVVQPLPTLPGNDAGAGRDSSGPGDAIPLALPGAYEGRFDEGDNADWYRVSVPAGQTLRFVLDPGAVNDFDLRVYNAALVEIPTGHTGLAPELVTVTGESVVYLKVERVNGGGNYLLAGATTGA